MPAGYEKMRDAFVRGGMSYDSAQAKAARIWNSKHPKRPVGASHLARGLARAATKNRRRKVRRTR